MRISLCFRTIGLFLIVVLASCGKPTISRPPIIVPADCEILHSPGEAADSIRVALLDAVDPQFAPWARNSSEQLLFSHLYETLITVDCIGNVQPGLAESWKSRRDGRRWTLELREGAEFWDGTPVTAADVLTSWQRASVEPMAFYAVIDSVITAGDKVLHVDFKERHRKVPRVLSAPALAIAKPAVDSRWPLGSGPYRIASSRIYTVMSERAITTRPTFGADEPVIQFLENSRHDARDFLGGVVDMMITSDPAVIEYAKGLPSFATVALPWTKTYVLLSTTRVSELRGGGRPEQVSADFSDALARDAVRGEARGYQSPSWWDDLYGCDELLADGVDPSAIPQSAAEPGRPRRILYDTSDPIARDLAERIVALASRGTDVSREAAAVAAAVPGLVGDGDRPVAEGLATRELSQRLWAGGDFAYVVSIPRLPPEPCYGARRLLNQAPWLVGGGVDLSRALVPLVDTRLHVIAREGMFGLVMDGYGNMLVVTGFLQGM
jgi:hypothetical protein